VWPGFQDDFAEAGLHPNYEFLTDQNTLAQTWERAVQWHPNVIQVATWNDYGEGTVVEPNTVRG